MRYAVQTFRAAGLEARWTRTREHGRIIYVRELHRVGCRWQAVDAAMWERAHEVGIRQAFDEVAERARRA